MPKILVYTLAFVMLLVGLSISYYFVVALPKKEAKSEKQLKELQLELKNTRDDISDTKDAIDQSRFNDTSSEDISNLQDSLDQMRYDQERENEQRSNCESNGGRYQGGGTCVYF